MTAYVGTDGIFIDGVHNIAPDPEIADKLNLLMRLREATDALGQGHKLIIVNGHAAPPPSDPASIYRYVDGCMIEWYDLVAAGKPRTPDQNLEFLQNAISLAKSGRVVWIKAWPYPNSFLDKAFNAKPYAEKVAAMNDAALFNVASYLVVEVYGYTFLHYSWGYTRKEGHTFWKTPTPTLRSGKFPRLGIRPY